MEGPVFKFIRRQGVLLAAFLIGLGFVLATTVGYIPPGSLVHVERK